MRNIPIAIVLTILFLANHIIAQDNVGIGTVTPDISSILELSATDKGILIPRMTSNDRIAIPNLARGLLVYEIDFDNFWYFDGVVWAQAVGPQGAQGPTGLTCLAGATGPAGAAGSSQGLIYLTWVSGSLSPGSGTLARYSYCADPANNASNWAGVGIMTPEDNAGAAGTAIGSDNLWYCPMDGTVSRMWLSIRTNSSASPNNTTYTFDLYDVTLAATTGVSITIIHTGNGQPVFNSFSGSVPLVASHLYTLRSVHSAPEISGVLSDCKLIVGFSPN